MRTTLRRDKEARTHYTHTEENARVGRVGAGEVDRSKRTVVDMEDLTSRVRGYRGCDAALLAHPCTTINL